MAKFLRLSAVLSAVLALCVLLTGLKAPPQYKGLLRFTQGEWSASPINVPDFREFPAEKPSKNIARDIDFKSHKHARRYRTRLREGLKEGANYNGHYNVVTVGCGTGCQYNFVLDISNGRVLESFYTDMGSLHRVDSALLVKNKWEEGIDVDLDAYVLSQSPIIYAAIRKGRVVELRRVETLPFIQLLKP